MRFAIFTVSVPEWHPTEAVAEIAGAGYEGVEWRVVDQPKEPVDEKPSFRRNNRCTWPTQTLIEDVIQMRLMTIAAGLEIPALGTYMLPHQLEAIEQAMRAAARIGVRQIRVNSGTYNPDREITEQWNARRAQYADVADLAATYGVRANVEVHHRQLTPSPHAARCFVDGFDPDHVGVIFDIGNMVWEGFTQYRLGLEAVGPYLAHVQVKNGIPVQGQTRDDGTIEWGNAQQTLRKGFADIPAFLRALQQVNYTGWVSVEDFSDLDGMTRTERIKTNLEYLVRSIS